MTDDPLASLGRRRDEGGASKLLLDRYAVGEALTDDERRRVEATLASDPRARAFVEEARLPPTPLSRPRPSRSALRRTWAPVLGVFALAATLMLVTTLGTSNPGLMPSGDVPADLADLANRTKGAAKLELIVRRADGTTTTALPDEVLHPGDAVRFRVSFPAARHVAVVGVDSARAVSAYVPTQGALVAMGPSKDHVFDGSVVLDSTLGPERFIAVFCAAPIDLARVLAAASHALERADGHVDHMAALDLPCDQDALSIRKARP